MWQLTSLTETHDFAQEFLSLLVEQGKHIVGLSGDLGAGKTTFVQFCGARLGVSETMVSPTFTIAKFYPLSQKYFPWKQLVHIDAYRLTSWKELEILGFKEVLVDPYNLVMIEWSENIQDYNQEDWVHLLFKLENETRIVTID